MFTFKTNKPTGPYRSFYDPTHTIKIKKVEVGSIHQQSPHRISLKVTKSSIDEDGNANCPWKWITLKKEFASVEEVKSFLKEHFMDITKKYNIWMDD